MQDDTRDETTEAVPPVDEYRPQPGGAARIVDVARRAQVSPATVSRVFNGSRGVKALHRERVLRAIDELDYRPNLLARNLRRQKAGMIGVLVSDIENPHFTAMVRAVEDATYRLGYRVLLCNTDESAEKQRAYLEMLAAERALGVILAPSDPAGKEIETVLDLGIPIVAFDRPVDDPRADAVVADNLDAGRQATAYLLAAGHARIGFIGDPGVETCVARQAGYEGAMRAAGLPSRVTDGRSRIAGGAEATEELVRDEATEELVRDEATEELVRDEATTALVVANNLMAIGALRVLRARGLRVPDRMSMVAIDDPFWAAIVEPPLTVLAQPVRQMAERVVALLLERIETGRMDGRRDVFACDLIERESVCRHTS
jgi:LacI family transcriptional regulator